MIGNKVRPYTNNQIIYVNKEVIFVETRCKHIMTVFVMLSLYLLGRII